MKKLAALLLGATLFIASPAFSNTPPATETPPGVSKEDDVVCKSGATALQITEDITSSYPHIKDLKIVAVIGPTLEKLVDHGNMLRLRHGVPPAPADLLMWVKVWPRGADESRAMIGVVWFYQGCSTIVEVVSLDAFAEFVGTALKEDIEGTGLPGDPLGI